MKYLKMLGLTAVAAAALMAWVGAGTASATTLTGEGCNGTPAGHCAVGTTIHAEAESHVTLHPPIGSITCSESVVKGKTTTTGGPSSSETVAGNIESLSFSGCNAEVVVKTLGSLEIHTQGASANNNGTLTSNGTRVTVVYEGFHCEFETTNTDIGTLTGSANTGGTATFDIVATIPRHGGKSGIFCGSTAQWTGLYKITVPDVLNID